jgi:hypothetical protein
MSLLFLVRPVICYFGNDIEYHCVTPCHFYHLPVDDYRVSLPALQYVLQYVVRIAVPTSVFGPVAVVLHFHPDFLDVLLRFHFRWMPPSTMRHHSSYEITLAAHKQQLIKMKLLVMFVVVVDVVVVVDDKYHHYFDKGMKKR